MNILALDTSLSACSAALFHAGQVFSSYQVAERQHARLILPMIHELLNSNGLSLNDIDVFSYGQGPASFTGTRIAVSVVQGLAYAVDKPVVPISSLALLAQTAFMENQSHRVLVALDARKEQVYWAAYQLNHDHQSMELIGQEHISTPANVVLPKTEPGQLHWQGIGDGWSKYPDILAASTALRPLLNQTVLLPHAKALLPLARISFEQGLYVAAKDALPIYL